MNLTEEQKRLLLGLARASIVNRLKGESFPTVPGEDVFQEKRGAFVTLHENGTLRGCIGYVQAIKPLGQTVMEMAQAAAFEDPRFKALAANELDAVRIEVSVLSQLKTVEDLNEIVVGKDGLFIKYGFYSGLLLPQVATEWGWDRETFLAQTCRKAGLAGDCYKKNEVLIFKFEAEIFSE